MGSLDGKVAIITGCGRRKGLGRAIAKALAGAGADIAAVDVDPGGTRNEYEADVDEAGEGWLGLPSLVDELQASGARSIGLVGDVGTKANVERMVAEAIERLGRVDIVVNNAAAPHGPERTVFWDVPEDAFDNVLRVNTKGSFLMSAAVTRFFLAERVAGRIVNIASAAGRQGVAQRAAYSASKFAIVGMTQSMAKDLISYGITANVVCPGGVDTARMSWSAPPGGSDGEGRLRRIGVPHDIARAVLFLAEPEAEYITGECINVNGGSGMF
jgi:NAD(P)-dependent dehydrogenase (short-subunit alcohol dehydrogenase family)